MGEAAALQRSRPAERDFCSRPALHPGGWPFPACRELMVAKLFRNLPFPATDGCRNNVTKENISC